MDSLFDKLINNEVISHLQSGVGRFVVEDNLQMAFMTAALFKQKPQRMVLVASSLYQAQQLYEELIPLIGEENTLFFPQDEVIRMDVEAYSKEMLSQRLYVLEKSFDDKPCVLICHVASLTRYLPQKELFIRDSLSFEVGKRYDIHSVMEKLARLGFARVNKIDQSLQFALRGDILDIYPINEESPVRIEFFDDEIESMRKFEIYNQRSTKEIMKVSIYPASDILLDGIGEEEIKKRLQDELNKAQGKIAPDLFYNLKQKINEETDDICLNGMNENYYKYYSFLYDHTANIIDYFSPEKVIVFDEEKCEASYNFLISQTYAYYIELFKAGLCLPKYELFEDYIPALNHAHKVIYTHSTYLNEYDKELKVRAVSEIAPNIAKSIEIIKKYTEENKTVIICLEGDQYDTYKAYLNDFEVEYEETDLTSLPEGKIGLCHYKLSDGIEFYDESLVLLSPKEVFGYRPHLTRFLNRYKEAKAIKNYEELEVGDYVVHDECGIGVFDGIVTLEMEGIHKDFIKIKYQGTDVLYVPLESFKMVRKFVSKEGAVPKINKLGGSDWERTKNKIKDKVNHLAERLLALYAERNALEGFAFRKDDEFQAAFEKAFPYPLTEDQALAVKDIKKDMEAPHPMDRLLCGDVGFGKTEVAFRAAFKAILSGAQVALLCPTTILARQHYERAIERFSLFGVRIALFSRFVPESVQNQQLKEISEGKIHFIIGTHRLLSKDIVIPNLKLLIVDEEQRFGVEHKERIKEVSKNIDVLTLTATPIPRTLQMSLLGIRSLSQLQGAPMNRMPIQTYVAPYEESLVREALERELARGGQAFYLHNNTTTIYSKANKIAKMIKGAKVEVVHGKMDKDQIEDVMAKFYANEANILVCTSIIETGLDIANANTIIIENADNFGLAQLYQIKGRVGRSNRIAYAYLLYNKNKELSDAQKKRLKAIKDFTELGSGYKIAQRDLTIRGAGDILGPEQAGFIDTVGIDMYIKLLNEVIKEKQGQTEEKDKVNVSNLQVDAYIPKKYAKDGDKLELYQEIQSVSTIPDLELFRDKLRDIYGKLPAETEMLLRKRKIDILASSPFIEEMKEEMGGVIVTLTKDISSRDRIGITLFERLGGTAKNIRGSFANRQIRLKLMKSPSFLDELEKMLNVIATINQD